MFVRRLVCAPLVFALTLAPLGAHAGPEEGDAVAQTPSEGEIADAEETGDESVAPVDDPFAATREAAAAEGDAEDTADPWGDQAAAASEASADVPDPHAEGPAPSSTPAERPPAIKCRKNEECPDDLACHLTQKVCMEPKYVVANAKSETKKLAIAAPIAIVMGGGFAGLGVWGIMVGQDEKEEADSLMGEEADDLRAQGNLKVGLGAGAVGIGSLAVVGALIGLAVLPIYVKRRKGAEKRLPATALVGPGSAGIALRF